MSSNKIMTGDKDLIKQINRSIVLEMIKNRGPISRIDLSKTTGLVRSTCSLIVDHLLNLELIVEIGKTESKGGKKPILLKLNKNVGKAIGLKVMKDKISGSLVDLEGEVSKNFMFSVTNTENINEYFDKTILCIKQLIKFNNKKNKSKILGVGIGLSGLVDSENGISLNSCITNWENVNFKKIIENKIKLPIYIENDVNTLVIGEKWLGLGMEQSNFICVTIGIGAGMGIVINGKIYSGGHFGAGEFGHMKFDLSDNAPLCACGKKKGCLESFISDPAMISYIKDMIKNGIKSVLQNKDEISIEDVYAAAKDNDELALNTFKRTGKYLGYALSNLIAILDPVLIIIGGEGVRAKDYIEKELLINLNNNTIYNLDKKVEISWIPFDDNIWERGAATLVFEKVFSISI